MITGDLVTIGIRADATGKPILPVGWRVSGSTVLDEHSIVRAIATPLMWGKADEHVTVLGRYSPLFVANGDGTAHMAAVDRTNNAELFASSAFVEFDPMLSAALQKAGIAAETAAVASVRTWLDKTFPAWRDPAAYWSPTLASLEPSTAVVGGPDVVMHARGSGFTAASVIVWNGGEEPTVFVDASDITTVVKPSTASGPWTIPVAVSGAEGEQDFVFTDPVVKAAKVARKS